MKGELILLSGSILRPVDVGDAPSLSRHGNNRNIWMHTAGVPYPFTVEICEQWIRERLENRKRILLAIEVSGEAAGCIALTVHPVPQSHSADIGYWLGEAHWNRGIVSEALAAVTTYGFVHHRLARIQAVVLEGNKASMRVLEKCGYVREGTLRKSIQRAGRVLDQALYAILQEPGPR